MRGFQSCCLRLAVEHPSPHIRLFFVSCNVYCLQCLKRLAVFFPVANHPPQICGRGDTVEALSHVLAQQRQAGTNQGAGASALVATTVASVEPGTGAALTTAAPSAQQQQAQRTPSIQQGVDAAAKPQPRPQLQPLSEHDFAKVKAAVRARDEPKLTGVSPGDGGGGGGSGSETPLGPAVATVASPLAPTNASPSIGGSTSAAASKVGSCGNDISGGAGIDQRLFAPVLRAILAGEGDHVLRRSLLCHPFLKGSKTGASSAAAVASPSSKEPGAAAEGKKSAPSPSGSGGGGSGRRKGSKGSKGGKAKKRDRDRDKDSGDWGSAGAAQVGPASRAEKKPLNAPREVSRLAQCAAQDGSLQSTLVFVKTLLCAVDPATAGVGERSRTSSSSSGRVGRGNQAATSGGATSTHAHGSADDAGKGSAAGAAVAGFSTSLAVRTAPLRALAGRGLSGWPDVLELLRREKYRERMVALRGRPSLTVCCGKADTRGRLEAKGEASGVVTAVQVRAFGTAGCMVCTGRLGLVGTLCKCAREGVL